MYQSLYRKYRPTDFENVYGQDIPKKILINSIKNNKLSHAYLFFGPRGTGKTSIAKMFARICNCENNNDGKCCENCDSCVASFEKGCVDIIEIDAASNNGVDEIRELKNKVNLVPSSLKYKVYIIDEVHMLSIGAFNALLKTLEEPPEHVIFILATTEFYKVPSTIVSRCQTIEFKNIDDNSMADRLSYIATNENILINKEAIYEIVKNSNGGLRDAIGLLDKVRLYVDKGKEITSDDVRVLLGTVSKSEIENMVSLIETSNVKDLLVLITEYVNCGKNLFHILSDLIVEFKTLVLEFGKYEYISVINLIDDYQIKMKASLNQKVLFEILMVELCNRTNVCKKTEIVMVEKNNKSPITEENDVDNFMIDSKLVEIRINNSFVNASKSSLNFIKGKWDLLKDLVFDTSYGSLACDLLDTVPVVASDKNVMVCCEYNSCVEKINSTLSKYDLLLKSFLSIDYKIVAVDKNMWQELKKGYLIKIKNGLKYEYIDELSPNMVDTNSFVENNFDNIDEKARNLFGDLLNE